uniref:Uncharacterized protein n=1 Tax=Micrurus spixii TaxID=129469 RepID=A0A2D4NG11_9SAUR
MPGRSSPAGWLRAALPGEQRAPARPAAAWASAWQPAWCQPQPRSVPAIAGPAGRAGRGQNVSRMAHCSCGQRDSGMDRYRVGPVGALHSPPPALKIYKTYPKINVKPKIK